VQDCQVCGRSFDPMGFQVVIPELGRGFDRIECAQTARLLATPGSRIAAVPVAAVIAPITAATIAPVLGLRPLTTPAATLGFLAAGTAVAALLWVRVLGTEPAAFPFLSASAPPAAASETVKANPGAEETGNTGATATASARADTPRPVVLRSSGGSGAAVVPAVARVTARAAGPSGSRGGSHTKNGGGKAKHKSNHGHDGKGHTKHGDSGTSHQPGHGQSSGQSAGSSGHGGGSGHGHSKKH
jgi:hypothetical protein